MLSRMVLCPIWLYIHWYFDTSGFISTGILTQLAFCTTGILALVYCAVVFSPMALWPWHYDNGIMAMAFCPNGILAMALWPGTLLCAYRCFHERFVDMLPAGRRVVFRVRSLSAETS